MKMPESSTIDALCAEFGTRQSALTQIGGGRGDNDGVAYRLEAGKGPVVLKIVSLERDRTAGVTAFDARIAFARFLSENGVRVASPIPLPDGRLYASQFEDDTLFVAYEMPFFAGKNPTSDMQTPELARAWGALTGRTHAVTQEYPLWRSMNNSPREFDYRDELNSFLSWAKEPFIKEHWKAMLVELDALPKSRDSYGFIHNDNHEQNVLADGTDIALIDFDCANCQFFMTDIATPMQGMLFENGGMCEPVKDPDRMRRFLEAFLEGYETQYHIGKEWIARIDLFIRYRRLLLATLLEGYLKQNEGMRSGFYAMMDAPEIIRL